MKHLLQVLALAFLTVISAVKSHAQQCDLKPLASEATDSTQAIDRHEKNSLSKAQASDACRIDFERWQRLGSSQKLVWDIRDLNARVRSPISEALAVSPAMLRGMQVSEGAAVMIVGQAIDPQTSQEACLQLRKRSIEAYVLNGGDRNWRTKNNLIEPGQLVYEAQLSVSEAAIWLYDEYTLWMTESTVTPITSSDSNKTILRKIVLVTGTAPPTNLTDDQFWWVRGDLTALRKAAQIDSVVAHARGSALTKPCGMN